VLQLGLQIIALVNLSKRRKVRFDNKLIWVLIIVLGNLIGPVAYFLFRGDEFDDGSSED
jgi:hypothetical protein